MHPDIDRRAAKAVGKIRVTLHDRDIATHIAGDIANADIFFKEDSIVCSGIYRARGNEAGMVYVVGASSSHPCPESSPFRSLPKYRSALFTAMTRSKGWLRVTGVGESMQELCDEYKKLQHMRYQLKFEYPTSKQLERMRKIHQDTEPRKTKADELEQDVKEGRKSFLEAHSIMLNDQEGVYKK